MSIDMQRVAQQALSTPAPVGPSPVVRIMLRPMTRLLNPLIRKIAGRPHFTMAAQIRHVGRRSGRHYVTPASARLGGEVILIPLTFGSRSDWARNVLAAAGCEIRLNGRDYQATEPEVVNVRDAGPQIRSVFSPMERASFRLLGIRQVLRLRAVPGPEVTGAGH